MSSGAIRVAARAVAIALPAAGAVVGLAAPASLLWGGLAWLGFLVAALAGWGHLATRALRAEVSVDLRLAWGTAAVLAVGGWLLAVGHCDRAALLALLAIGFSGYAWRHVVEPEPAVSVLARRAAALRRDPQAAILWAVLVVLAAINVLGAVARLRGNHFDDDVAYTPLVRRLLETGALDEPFSFRRLSAAGGQTILAGLGAARGTLANLFLVDHGLYQIVTLALVIGLLRRLRPADPFVAGLVLLVLLLLPDASTNTASYWTGAALFLALYRTATALDELPRGGFVALGGLAAAAASLRQNYVPVAVLFPALVLALRLRRPYVTSLRADARAWGVVVLAGAVTLVPYLIASWRSNATFMYPLQLGTGNPQLQTTPLVWSAWQELQFFLRVSLDPNPVRVMVPLLPVIFLCRDRRRGAPLLALTVACAVGYVALVHAFTLSDARNLWRYAFGYMTVLAVVVIVEVAGRGLRPRDDDATPPPVRASLAARVIVVACVLAQFTYSAKTLLSTYKHLGADLAAAHRDRPATSPAVAALYARLQTSIPVNAPLVALLDEPIYLDYARNRIINLDTPGFASYAPGLPMFLGAEAKAAYFRGHGLRYLAFVRGDRSRYFYRRDYWHERIFWDMELWRIVAAYQLDLADSLATLATTYPVRFDEDGLVVLDLAVGAAAAGAVPGRAADEHAAREAFVRALAERDGLHETWSLMSRGDLVFEDGWSRVLRVEPDPDGGWEVVPRTDDRDRGRAVRWIGDVAHARVRGAGDHVLRIRGHVDVAAIFNRPRAALSVDGHELVSRLVEPDGAFDLEAIVPADWIADWTDLYLELSSVGEPWRDPALTQVVRVERVDWEPRAMIALGLGALAIGLALHGLGRTVGWLVADDDAPAALAIAWGLALYLALGGWLAAAGGFAEPIQIGLVVVGNGLGPVWAIRRGAPLVDVTRAVRAARAWRPGADTLVVAATFGLLVMYLAGAAGLHHAGFDDGDGDLRGQLARLAQTGALGDGGARPRGAGLGGTTIATSLGWVFGDRSASHAVDALGLALAVALALGRRGDGPIRPYLGFALGALALGLPTLPLDLAPRWTVVALVLAGAATLHRAAAVPTRPRLDLAPTLLAAAVAALVHGGLGLLAAVVLCAPRRGGWWRQALVVGGALGGHALGFVRSGATLAPTLPRAAAGLVVAAVVWAVVAALTRGLDDRPLATTLTGIALALGVTVTGAVTWPSAGWLALPFAMAAVLLVVIAGLRALDEPGATIGPASLIAALTVAMVLAGLRVRIGLPPSTWGERLAAVVDVARAHGHRPRTPSIERAAYRAAFAAIPDGARVGIWVDRGDLVDYRHHRVVDLRSARPRRSRALAGLDLDYVVVAPSAALAPDDPLHAVVAAGTPIAPGDLSVVRLRR